MTTSGGCGHKVPPDYVADVNDTVLLSSVFTTISLSNYDPEDCTATGDIDRAAVKQK
jgi:hypothetical protein